MPGAAERVKALFIVDQEWKAFGFGPVTCLCHSFPQENAPLCSNQSDEAGHLSSRASIQISSIRKKRLYSFLYWSLWLWEQWGGDISVIDQKSLFKNIKNWHTRCARWCNDSNLDNNLDDNLDLGDNLEDNLDDNLEDNLDDLPWWSTVDSLENISNLCQISKNMTQLITNVTLRDASASKKQFPRMLTILPGPMCWISPQWGGIIFCSELLVTGRTN